MGRAFLISLSAILVVAAVTTLWLLRFEYNDDKTARVNRLTGEVQFLCMFTWASSIEDCAGTKPIATTAQKNDGAVDLSTAKMVQELALMIECDRLRKEGEQKLAEEKKNGVKPWNLSWSTEPPWCAGVKKPPSQW